MAAGEREFNEAAGARLRRARLAAGRSQQVLADLVDLPRTSLIQIEGGRQRLSVYHLVRLAEALGADVVALIGGPTVARDELPPELRAAPATIVEFVSKAREKARTDRRPA